MRGRRSPEGRDPGRERAQERLARLSLYGGLSRDVERLPTGREVRLPSGLTVTVREYHWNP